MPQPLSRFNPSLGLMLAAGNTPHDAQMASSVLGVINLWSQIEYNYAVILSRIASADPVTVTAVFHAMVSGEARQAALFAAAKERLTLEESSLIMAVIDATKSSRNTRNAFAHHLWGELHGRPDCVILAHPKDIARWNAGVEAQATQELASGQMPHPDLNELRAAIMVWQQPDFDAALAAAREAHEWVVQLPFTFEHPAAARRRQTLLAVPQIQNRYNRYLENAG